MGMAAILLSGVEPFEQIVNIPSTEGLTWNLVKIGREVLEKKTFKDYMIVYRYIAQGQGELTPGGQTFDCTKKFLAFIIHCKFQPLAFNTFGQNDFNIVPIQKYIDANSILP